MFDKEVAIKHLGELTQEQEDLLEQASDGKMTERALFERLGVDKERFVSYVRALEERKEAAIFDQTVSEEELKAVSGGFTKLKDCAICEHRDIYDGKGFANCTDTVESGSWCMLNDACYYNSIIYDGMQNCKKAWE